MCEHCEEITEGPAYHRLSSILLCFMSPVGYTITKEQKGSSRGIVLFITTGCRR